MNKAPFVQVEAALGYLKLASEIASPEEREKDVRMKSRMKPIIPREYDDWVDQYLELAR